MKRNASAKWQGDLKTGKGTVSTDSGVLSETQYSFSTRFENGKGTNPEELIAAAHAGCFTMALSGQLGAANLVAEQLATTATVTMEKVEAGWTVTGVHLSVTGKVPKADAASLGEGDSGGQGRLSYFTAAQRHDHHGCEVGELDLMAVSQDPDSVAFLFDLDGTLVDSVYQHVLAWREATQAAGIELPVWRIHRQIGMSGGLMLHALWRETGRPVSKDEAERIQRVHADAFAKQAPSLRVLPGAQALLNALTAAHVPYAIATSGRLQSAQHTLKLLKLPPGTPVVTRDQVQRAKPDPDLFLAAAEQLRVPIAKCIVVGDSVWDLLAARRASALGVGLLSGGYGREELERAGAYRTYDDPADLLRHLDECGVRPEPPV
jgi:OsmC subfamily peroxiredoxin/HAD superfamily hydrolase (TIGR01509 family)